MNMHIQYVHIHTYYFLCLHTRMHTYAYARTHTRAHTHTHTHTHTWNRKQGHTHTHTHETGNKDNVPDCNKASKSVEFQEEKLVCVGYFFPFGFYYVMLESIRLVRAHAHMSNRAFCGHRDTFLYCFGLLQSFTPAYIPVTRWSVWMSRDPQPHIYSLGIWVMLTD